MSQSLGKTIFQIVFSLFLVMSPLVTHGQGSHLPDGTLGKPNGLIYAQYASMTTGGTVMVTDQKSAGIEITLPAFRELTFSAAYFARKGDSVYHNYFAEMKIYLAGPIREPGKCNPDGKIFTPVFSFGYGGEFPDQNPPANKYRAGIQALVPLSPHFSLGAGGNYYQDKITRHADKVYGVLNIFPRAYSASDLYLNPDGIEGVPSLSLSGGGSEKGFFGQLDVLIPLNAGTTLTFYTRGERYPKPYLRTAILGCRVSIYPSSN
ncbi:hypothetical protein TRIP_C20238 [Candidatus Zixiibacteriota bacterium]|nr:hypothetical protein TRIP_C20238 [candidate division Zixibacteria bacterium]